MHCIGYFWGVLEEALVLYDNGKYAMLYGTMKIKLTQSTIENV